MIPPPPGVTLVTVGEARREFPDREIGEAVEAWGDSPAVPRSPDDEWCWVLDGGLEIRERFKTAEEACMDAWRMLWWVLEMRPYSADEQKLAMRTAQTDFLRTQGWGFPDGYKESRRESNAIRKKLRGTGQ